MTATLRDTIQVLAADFAAGVLGAIRGASLEDILTQTVGTGTPEGGVARRGRPPSLPAVASRAPARAPRVVRSGRLQRRSASDIGDVIGKIVELLSRNPKGLRAEQIRAVLSLSSKELPRPIAQALSSKQISKSGQKRATTYYARGAGTGPASSKGAREKTSGKGAGRKAAKRSARAAKGRAASLPKPAARPGEEPAAGAAEAT